MPIDVLGIGCSAVDDVLYVDRYPEPDSKVQVRRRERRCGGLTAVALMTAARLGASCAYAGVLGSDPLSRFVIDALASDGVDTSTVVPHATAAPVHSTIVVDQQTGSRTILFDSSNTVTVETQPSAEAIAAARVLFVDHYGAESVIRAARIARKADVPVVADLESDTSPRFGELLEAPDHLILSRGFASHVTGSADPATAATKLMNAGRSVVVITAGADGCWAIERGGQPVHFPGFPVTVRDTTGCGDVFHGAYAATLAKGLPVPQRIRLASAAAAIKAGHAGDGLGVSSMGQIEAFLARQK